MTDSNHRERQIHRLVNIETSPRGGGPRRQIERLATILAIWSRDPEDRLFAKAKLWWTRSIRSCVGRWSKLCKCSEMPYLIKIPPEFKREGGDGAA